MNLRNLGSRQPPEERREPLDPAFTPAPHHTLALSRRTDPRHAAVPCVALARDETRFVERLGDARHRRGTNLLCGRELTERPRAAEDEDRERREPRGAQAGRRILPPDMTQRVNRR
jgi:hypothetical protein